LRRHPVELVAAALLGVIAFLVALLPFRSLATAGAFVGWLCGRVLRIRRGHVTGAMAVAGVTDGAQAADGMYRALGVSLLELLWLAGRAPRRPRCAVDADVVRMDPGSAEALARAAQDGRGIVLGGAHTGNWELAACALATRAPLLVVAKPLSVGLFDAFARRTRGAYGVELAAPEGALGVAQRALAQGGWVTLLIDQVPSSSAHGVPVSFLGQPALASRAPAALAWRSGAPLLVVAARRDASGVQVLTVLESLVPPAGAGRDWIDRATVASTRALERFVLAHPTQWLWLHRRWRMPSAMPAACFSPGTPLHGRAS
jgi:KDO2-lipid IV(A) lauroyltransferase